MKPNFRLQVHSFSTSSISKLRLGGTLDLLVMTTFQLPQNLTSLVGWDSDRHQQLLPAGAHPLCRSEFSFNWACQVSSPYSIAQMPVPVPISRTREAVSAPGDNACFPSRVNLNRWFWRSVIPVRTLSSYVFSRKLYLDGHFPASESGQHCATNPSHFTVTSSFGSMYSLSKLVLEFQQEWICSILTALAKSMVPPSILLLIGEDTRS